MDPSGPSSAPLVASAHLETELQAVQATTPVAAGATAPAVPALAAAPARTAQVQVAVPMGAEIGQEISFVRPDGEAMSVRSTQRLAPGSVLTVQYALEPVATCPPQTLAVQASAPPAPAALQAVPPAPMEVELGEAEEDPPVKRCAGRGAVGTLLACGGLLLLLAAVGHRHLHLRHHWRHRYSSHTAGHYWHTEHRGEAQDAGEDMHRQEYHYGYYAATSMDVNATDLDQGHSGHARHHRRHRRHRDHNETRQSHREVHHGEFYYDYYSNHDSVVEASALNAIKEQPESPAEVAQSMSGTDAKHEILA